MNHSVRKELIFKAQHVSSVLKVLIAKEGRSLVRALLDFIAKEAIHHQPPYQIHAQLIDIAS